MYLTIKDLKVGDTVKSQRSYNWETVMYIPEDKEWVVLKHSNKKDYCKNHFSFKMDSYVLYKPPVEKVLWVNYKVCDKGHMITTTHEFKEKAIDNANYTNTIYQYLQTHYTIWCDNKLYSGAWVDLKEKDKKCL